MKRLHRRCSPGIPFLLLSGCGTKPRSPFTKLQEQSAEQLEALGSSRSFQYKLNRINRRGRSRRRARNSPGPGDFVALCTMTMLIVTEVNKRSPRSSRTRSPSWTR
jgi:hypothetical protein